jgi:membrane-bound lytic murein transglycosylase F
MRVFRWLAMAALGACVALSASAGDLPEIKQRGALRVLFVPNNSPLPGDSPFFTVKNARASGFDAEVLSGFARSQGLKFEVVPIGTWDALVPSLLQDKGDLIAGNITATEGRRKIIDFTQEVLPTRIVVLTRRPHARITTREQLFAEKVAVTKGTSPQETLLGLGFPKQNLEDSYAVSAILDALKSGRCTAIAFDLQGAVDAQRLDPELELGMFLGPAESLAYGVRKDQPQLLRALNNYIGSSKANPIWYRLVVQSFGASAPEVLKRARTEN